MISKNRIQSFNKKLIKETKDQKNPKIKASPQTKIPNQKRIRDWPKGLFLLYTSLIPLMKANNEISP